jgi:hypothetical protein
MKKGLILICGLTIFMLTSCTKECTCTTKYTGGGMEMPDVVVTAETEGKCSDANSTITVGEMTATTTCQ